MALGPFVLSLPRLFLLLAVVAALGATLRHGRARRRQLEPRLWLLLALALVGARLGYLALHWPDYAAAPVEALYFWRGGFHPWIGLGSLALAWGLLWRRRGGLAVELLPALLTGLAVWGGAHWLHHALDQALDQPLPALAVMDLEQRELRLDRFRGQPVVLNLWASWCPPCRREMPVLQAAQQQHPEVHVVFLNQGEGPGTVRRFLAAEQLDLDHVLLDLGSQASRHFHSTGLPTTLFFNAEGKLVATHLGELSRGHLGDALRRLQSASPDTQE